ncbi:MAG: aldehyde ferredoxin oxidoreductase C-terminal domain-containing protein, partial [Candidatus Bathyarchaeia archaeon]
PDLFWYQKKEDDNPPRFYEPLPSGPHKGETTDRQKVMAEKKKYFEGLGWDEYGVPKPETLKRLGLEKIKPAVERIRRRI